MNLKKMLSIVFVIAFTFAFLSTFVVKTEALADAHPQSSKIALVPGASGQAGNGGSLPTSGDLTKGWPNNDFFTFVDISPDTIMNSASDPLQAGGFDTVVFVQLYLVSSADASSYWGNTIFRQRINDFVYNGGKLIIYDSEIISNDYSSFIYPFKSNNPGATGEPGNVWVVENNTLGTNETTSSRYLYGQGLCIPNDADTGDDNAMTSYDPNWHVHMVCTNINGVTGPVHTYAEYGKGLIIYNGEDMDAMTGSEVNNNNVSGILGMIFYLELKQQWNPTGLEGSVGVSGISLTPIESANPVRENHTVTAHVTDRVANPIEGVTVNFNIKSGPNQGTSASNRTDANGAATFTWSSTNAGTDKLEAYANSPLNQTLTISAYAYQFWSQTTNTSTITASPEPQIVPDSQKTENLFPLDIFLFAIFAVLCVACATVGSLTLRARNQLKKSRANLRP